MKYIYLAGLLLLAGCLVQSIHPFYTPASVVTPTHLAGDWFQISDKTTTNQTQPAWPLTAKTNGAFVWETYDDSQKPGNMNVTFFRVGTNLFCDLMAGDLPSEHALNGYWIFHITPVHSVARVETNANQLTIIPLDEQWLRRSVLSNEVTLAHIQRQDDDFLIYTATAKDWMQFLGRHGNNTNAFPMKNAYHFQRHR